jgi:predicted CXXCH cytochrome family protein
VNVATADCIDCHRYHHDPTKTITTVVPKIQQAPQAQGATQ